MKTKYDRKSSLPMMRIAREVLNKMYNPARELSEGFHIVRTPNAVLDASKQPPLPWTDLLLSDQLNKHYFVSITLIRDALEILLGSGLIVARMAGHTVIGYDLTDAGKREADNYWEPSGESTEKP
jgi:hypothetical protein